MKQLRLQVIAAGKGGKGAKAPGSLADIMKDFQWPAGVARDGLSPQNLILRGSKEMGDPNAAAKVLKKVDGVTNVRPVRSSGYPTYTFDYAGATIQVEFDEDGVGALKLL